MANYPLGKLDHVGIAVRSVDEARKFFEDVLGARFLHESARPEEGFRVVNFQLQGVIIELIEPMGEDSFVRKFIDKPGEGMHHLTFNVPDAREKVAQLKARGVRIVDEREWPDSFEAFISPRSSHGVLIQIGSGFPTLSDHPQWYAKRDQASDGANGGDSMNTAEEIEQLRLVAEISGLKPPKVVLPDEGDVIVEHFRLHYLDWGRPGPGAGDVLFLHGGGRNAHTWDGVSLMLRTRYRCVALDQRGHGNSEWSPGCDYAMASHLRDIEGFVAQMKLRRPVLVGQSMGGINAINYASRHSEEMAGLVVVDVGPEIIAAGGARIRDFIAAPQLDSPEEFLQRATKFNPLRDPRILRRSLYYNLRQLPNGKWTWKHDTRRTVESQGEDMARAAAHRAEELWQAVPRIKCPTMVVRGALSDVISDTQAEKFAKALPNGRFVRVEKAGHNVQGDNPAGLLAVLEPFLEEVTA